MTTIVECPNCGTEFDAEEGSFYQKPCPGCTLTWTELHALVEQADDPEPTVSYPSAVKA